MPSTASVLPVNFLIRVRLEKAVVKDAMHAAAHVTRFLFRRESFPAPKGSRASSLQLGARHKASCLCLGPKVVGFEWRYTAQRQAGPAALVVLIQSKTMERAISGTLGGQAPSAAPKPDLLESLSGTHDYAKAINHNDRRPNIDVGCSSCRSKSTETTSDFIDESTHSLSWLKRWRVGK
jgi:hypothetical protein